jgi:hypothetical protein
MTSHPALGGGFAYFGRRIGAASCRVECYRSALSGESGRYGLFVGHNGGMVFAWFWAGAGRRLDEV